MKKSNLAIGLMLALCISGCTQNNQSASQLSSALYSESSASTSAPSISSSASELQSQSSADASSSKDEISTSESPKVESDTSVTPDYQGLTQEQWNKLQNQKEKYGHLSEKARGGAEFNGEIECMEFNHLHWEHLIDARLINYVGANEFESWLKEIDSINNPDQCTIYSFAEYFSITLDELVSLIETNGGTEVYNGIE